MPCSPKPPPEWHRPPNAAPRRALLGAGAALVCLAAWPVPGRAQIEEENEERSGEAESDKKAPDSPRAASLAELRTLREADGGLLLTARVRFALAPALEQALLKGVPLHFMAEAVVLRSRWYWRDRRLAERRHYWRLAYLPLMRRWRVLASDAPLAGVSAPAPDAVASLWFDSLAQALEGVQRLHDWPVMAAAHFEPGRKHTLRFRYLLLGEELPRPLQDAERIEVQRDIDLTLERAA